ncbi:hypothetical protein KB553_14875 [Chryseobacterium rhizoplanae]|uniref:hypothetical protein n=1 Tax=Chryseobacterium TaxID=59732 RepID=UPI001CE285B8|nr:hypothetical protein [Chryseobacterium rhizoplanae]UCA58327.1 hypothetical protein KB553_14875 [Chryseobacterium rhizoplanae]
MKKLLFTGLLGLGLLLPANISASANSTVSAKELFKKPGKRKTKTSRKSKSKRSSYSSPSYYSSSGSKGCTYNGNQLYVGSRGGCYYYSGNSKQYVDRSYCAGCN